MATGVVTHSVASPETPSAPGPMTDAMLRRLHAPETPIQNQGMSMSVEAPSKKMPELDLSTQIAVIHEFNQFCKMMNEYRQKDDPRLRSDGMAQMALAVWERNAPFFAGLDDPHWADKKPPPGLSINKFADSDKMVMLGVLNRKLDELANAEGYERTRPNARISQRTLTATDKPGEFDLVPDEDVQKEKAAKPAEKPKPAVSGPAHGAHEQHEEPAHEPAHTTDEKRAYSYRTQPPEKSTPEKRIFPFSLLPEKKSETTYYAPMEFSDLVRAGYLKKLPGAGVPGSLPPTEQRYVGLYAEKIDFLRAYSPRERARMIINLQNTEIALREQIVGVREKINPFYSNPDFGRDDLHRIALVEEYPRLLKNEGGKVSTRRHIELRQMAYEQAVRRKAGDVVDYMLNKQKEQYNENHFAIKAARDTAAREKTSGYKVQATDGKVKIVSKTDYDTLVATQKPLIDERSTQQDALNSEQAKLNRIQELTQSAQTRRDRERELDGLIRTTSLGAPLHTDAGMAAYGAAVAASNPGLEPKELSARIEPVQEKYMKYFTEREGIRRENNELIDLGVDAPNIQARLTAAETRIGQIDTQLNAQEKPLGSDGEAHPENVARREFIVGSEQDPHRFSTLLNQSQKAMYSPEQRRDALGSFRNLRRAIAGTYDENDKKNLTYEVFGDRILINNLVDVLGVSKDNFLKLGLVEQTQNQLTGATLGEFNPTTGKIDFDSMSDVRNDEVIGLLERYLLSRMQQLTPEQNAEILMAIMKERLRASGEVDPLAYSGNEYRNRIRLRRKEVRPVPIASREVPKNPGIYDLGPNT